MQTKLLFGAKESIIIMKLTKTENTIIYDKQDIQLNHNSHIDQCTDLIIQFNHNSHSDLCTYSIIQFNHTSHYEKPLFSLTTLATMINNSYVSSTTSHNDKPVIQFNHASHNDKPLFILTTIDRMINSSTLSSTALATMINQLCQINH